MRTRTRAWQVSLALGVSALTLAPLAAQARSQQQTSDQLTVAQAQRRLADPAPTVPPQMAQADFPGTGTKGQIGVGQGHEVGSGNMHEEDRTSSTGPSGSRPFSTTTSSVDSTARAAKIAGDEAVTAIDRDIAARVRTALSGDLAQPISDQNVHIKVNNGQVILQGRVNTQDEKDVIGAKVARLDGVQGVDNQLIVSAR